MARVDISIHSIVTEMVGTSPDVLALDPGLGWLYVAAESGDLTVLDISKAGLAKIDSEHVDNTAHTVAVNSATHLVYFPLEAGPLGTPILRIMRPANL